MTSSIMNSTRAQRIVWNRLWVAGLIALVSATIARGGCPGTMGDWRTSYGI